MQLATQMLAEFLEPAQHREAVATCDRQGVVVRWQTEGVDQGQDALGVVLCEEAGLCRVDGVDGDSDGNRFAVTEPIAAE